jgi:DNA topoisomerase-2
MNAARKKKLSVERIYQKKTPIEHILLRPDTYIGSVEEVTQSMWVFEEDRGFVQRQITFVPGLYKIFDEILVNAADNKQRDRSMNKIEIDIDSENDLIRIWNNGRGIPIETHKVEGKLVPTMIFGELLTSSNYDDTQKKVTGGRNGYGAKLCNIFSTKFTVETACAESGKKFKQSWKNNMSSCSEADVKPFSGRDYTCVTFKPDLTKFGMEQLDRDIVALMTRRAYDVAGATNGVKVYLNGKLLSVRSFRDYVDLYLKSVNADSPLGERSADQVVHEKVNDRWEVCVTPSFSGFQQVSFVNSIATTKGGSHIDHVTKQLVEKLSAAAKRRNKGGADMKPHMVKSHLWVFVNCLIENPAFDSQTKENMTLKVKSFGSECIFSDKFLKKVIQCGVVDLMVTSAQAKLQAQLSRKAGSTGRQTKLKGIPKLDDANSAGGKKSRDCTLILTEGDSAKTLAVSGLSVVGRDLYGVFPLRGKVLNVREASAKQMTENAEITNIVKIMGLKYGKKYTESDLSSLRYGHLMVMTDQDQDGSHIKGLLINFIHYNWPSLLRVPFMEQFITPIVKVSKGKEEIPFYSIPEFEEWKQANPTQRSWKVKYYKGLGTSTPKEAKEYFQDMERHRISFSYSGPQDDESIKLAFSKSEVDARKRWLDCWLQERKDKRAQGLNESYLYGSETDVVTYSDFVNKELVQFSNADNERSIPSIVDGELIVCILPEGSKMNSQWSHSHWWAIPANKGFKFTCNCELMKYSTNSLVALACLTCLQYRESS